MGFSGRMEHLFIFSSLVQVKVRLAASKTNFPQAADLVTFAKGIGTFHPHTYWQHLTSKWSVKGILVNCLNMKVKVVAL